MVEVTYLEALRQGLWEEMERDPSVFILGEDVGAYGGAFKVTEGFAKQFGEARVIDTPISEAAIRSEEHTSELQSRLHLVCRLLLEKKKKNNQIKSTRSS